jgi:hypothetical protein
MIFKKQKMFTDDDVIIHTNDTRVMRKGYKLIVNHNSADIIVTVDTDLRMNLKHEKLLTSFTFPGFEITPNMIPGFEDLICKQEADVAIKKITAVLRSLRNIMQIPSIKKRDGKLFIIVEVDPSVHTKEIRNICDGKNDIVVTCLKGKLQLYILL